MTKLPKDILIPLDREQALYIYNLWYSIGDYFAAGAPIDPSFNSLSGRIGSFPEELEKALGIKNFNAGIQEYYDKQKKNQK